MVINDNEMRQEIEVELQSLDEEKFSGTLTVLEAKHGIYRDCLELASFDNFDK